jgi:hypothetical protein
MARGSDFEQWREEKLTIERQGEQRGERRLVVVATGSWLGEKFGPQAVAGGAGPRGGASRRQWRRGVTCGRL